MHTLLDPNAIKHAVSTEYASAMPVAMSNSSDCWISEERFSRSCAIHEVFCGLGVKI